ncbi:asparagine synthase [Bacillus sp. Xin]|uniref:asparagine synthase-related protein n=1 Tax=unclassified Bacillus (in: firmicutes) TaxID=185979 RepID=UPI0015725565|nr:MULTISPECIES: asparagine synthetase B family protein [unclassified Bacillus (in: firmicutes)]MBC6973539.1 asparagine synthase [Bacillus sp. Xin]NSW39496.1 asparagine synthase [Bacillus sp. Xin1]
MKIWFGMQGKSSYIWDKWLSSISKWGSTTDFKIINNSTMFMAETIIDYDENRYIDRLHKVSMSAPIIMDGWINGELTAKSNGVDFFFDDYQDLYQKLNSSNTKTLSSSNGEFTILWWDENIQSLTAVTDIYATRPIYYWLSSKGEWFISNDIRILLLVPDIPFQVDEEVCKMFPTSGFAVGENGFEDRTFFKGIKKLPAASLAYFKFNSIQTRKYWGISNLLDNKNITKNATPLFRELFQEVTKDRLKDKKHIVELSGGLDSATVMAAAIATENTEKILAVNISFSDPDMFLSHDRDLVKNMIKDLNIPGLIILGDKTARIPNAEIGRDPLWFIDGPDPRANALVNETFTVLAREYGASSVLTGEGGDFLFSGGEAVIDSLIRQGRFNESYDILKKWAGNNTLKMCKLALQYGFAPFLPYIGEKLYYKLLWSDTEYELPEYFTNKHKEREEKINKEDYQRYQQSKKLLSWGKRYHFDFLWPRARYMDSIGVSLPAYHPFLDRRLIEFSFSVSPEQHFDILKGQMENYAGSKMLLRKSFTDILPSYIYNRSTKTTYAHMARKSFLNDRKHILQLFLPGERILVAEMGIINTDMWWKHLLAMAIRSEDPNNDLGMGYQYMRSVIDLEIWLREASQGKDHLLERSRPRKPRLMADIEKVNINKKGNYSYYSYK